MREDLGENGGGMNSVHEDEPRGPDFLGLFNGSGEGNLSGGQPEEGSLPSKPYRDPLYVVIPITVIYAAIFLTGIVGNISTCVVIARNKHMHTATNYYLFSLAVSDLLLLVSGLPPEVFFMWRKHSYVFGETFCVLQSFAAETSANATVLTITAFTIERYVAICHPFQSHTLSKLSRAVKFVIAIWVSALGLAIPQAIQYGVVTVLGPDSSESYCTLKKVLIPNAFLISICVFFVVPMTVITVLYVLIGLKLRKSRVIKRPSFNRGDVSRHRAATSQSHVIKMLVAVVVGFFICWAPFHAQRLVAMYGHLDEHPSKTVYIVYIFLTYISGVLYYLSTTINPLLYHIMSHKFREAFKFTLVQLCSGKKRKSGEKRKLYLTLSRQSHRLSSRDQPALNLVSFHNVKSPAGEPPANGALPRASFPAPRAADPRRAAPARDSSVVCRCDGRNLRAVELKITNLGKEQEAAVAGAPSRGSSSSSQVTLTTSCGKAEEEANGAEGKCNGRAGTEGKGKRKCNCWNCEKKVSALSNGGLFKGRSQSAALEAIAKKIGFRKPSESKGDGSQARDKPKLKKTPSSYTISNSSLQDLDESEFTSSELADVMRQMKHGEEVQV